MVITEKKGATGTQEWAVHGIGSGGPQLWVNAALPEVVRLKQLKHHAQGHLPLLERPWPSCAAKVMHEAPGTKAAWGATPGSHTTRQGHAETDQQKS